MKLYQCRIDTIANGLGGLRILTYQTLQCNSLKSELMYSLPI